MERTRQKMQDEKGLVQRRLEERISDLCRLCDTIYQHPEYNYHEYKACAAVSDLLGKLGFQTDIGYGGLETAVCGVYDSGKPGPNLGFLCEYDAVPGMGHACGHNIMAPIAIGAAEALMPVADTYGGKLTVIGTPAEEGGGGKIVMLQNGAFGELDTAMLIHAANETVVNDISYSTTDVLLDFYGRDSHAFTWPEEGISSLIPAVELINLLQALRLEQSDKGRIMAVITQGGDDAIHIPNHCQILATVRSFVMKNKMELLDRLIEICKHLAAITRTRFEYQLKGYSYEDIRNNPDLEDLLSKNFEALGEPVRPRRRELGIGCTDMGNVTHVVPGLQSYIQVVPELRGHTKEFEEACGTQAAYRAIQVAAKAVAMTGVDLLANPGALAHVRGAFRDMQEKYGLTGGNHGQ